MFNDGLSREYICTLFKLLTGLDDNLASQWEPLWVSAEKSLLGRLRPGVDTKAEGDRLCMAVAGMAAAQYKAFQTIEGEELRVGSISLKSSKGNAKLQGVEEYIAQVSDLLLPVGFAFLQTPEVLQ